MHGAELGLAAAGVIVTSSASFSGARAGVDIPHYVPSTVLIHLVMLHMLHIIFCKRGEKQIAHKVV